VTQPEAALLEIAAFLDGLGLPYMLTGDMAAVAWGIRRSLPRIKFGVWAEDQAAVNEAIHAIGTRFGVDPRSAEEGCVLLVSAANGVDATIVFVHEVSRQFFMSRVQMKSIAGTAIAVACEEDVLRSLSERHVEAALIETVEFLRSAGALYKVIGGVAVAAWGGPGEPKDVDLVICSRRKFHP
jgi:hypothetical protein